MPPSPGDFVVALVVAGDVSADALQPATTTLREFGIQAREVAIQPGSSVEEFARDLGLQAKADAWRAVIVASADAPLPAAVAAAVAIPVVRVPVATETLTGLALLRTAEGDLPAAARVEVSFATVAIGPAGARNAALFAVSILALEDADLCAAWEGFRARQTSAVLQQPPPHREETTAAGA